MLVAPWNHRGTVDAVVVLSGGGRVKRWVFKQEAEAEIIRITNQIAALPQP